MEQKTGRSGQNIADITYESILGSFDAQVAITPEETPEIRSELPDFCPRQVTVDKTIPDNLPSIPKKLLLFPTWQIKSATKHIAEFTQTVSGFKLPDELQDKYKDELQTLGNVNKVLSRHHRELAKAQKAFDKTKKDKTIKDKSVACYLQEKQMLDVLNTSSTEMLGVIISLVQLTGVDIKDINQSAQLDIVISTHTDINIEESKKAVYLGTIKLLIQTAAKLKSHEEKISQHLQQQEELIQLEYYQKTQQIDADFKKSNRIPETCLWNGWFMDDKNNPRKILKFHQFDIEYPKQYPDYQISRHYLNVIHTWVFEHLLDQKQEIWKMIVRKSPNLRKIYELANKLLENVKPELQTDSMKEVVELLEYMTNKESKWQKPKRRKQEDIKYSFDDRNSPFFLRIESRNEDSSSSRTFFTLNGELIGQYSMIHSGKKLKDNMVGTKEPLSQFLLNYKGQIISKEFASIGDVQSDGNRIATKNYDSEVILDPIGNIISDEYSYIEWFDESKKFRIACKAGNVSEKIFILDSEGKIIFKFKCLSDKHKTGNHIITPCNQNLEFLVNSELQIISDGYRKIHCNNLRVKDESSMEVLLDDENHSKGLLNSQGQLIATFPCNATIGYQEKDENRIISFTGRYHPFPSHILVNSKGRTISDEYKGMNYLDRDGNREIILDDEKGYPVGLMNSQGQVIATFPHGTYIHDVEKDGNREISLGGRGWELRYYGPHFIINPAGHKISDEYENDISAPTLGENGWYRKTMKDGKEITLIFNGQFFQEF
jgi:hypothetical protein